MTLNTFFLHLDIGETIRNGDISICFANFLATNFSKRSHKNMTHGTTSEATIGPAYTKLSISLLRTLNSEMVV